MTEPANITPSEAAQITGLNLRRIQRWCRNNWVAHYRTPGGHIKLTRAQVDALLEFRAPREHHPEIHTPNPAYRGPRLRLVEQQPRRSA